MKISCFTAYDIRGQLGKQIDDNIIYRIARAYATHLRPKAVVVGADVRLSSEGLKQALIEGFRDSGVNVFDIGLSGTEEVYFATQYLDVDGGVEITASHNPIDYNGLKLVKKDSIPISSDSGLLDIKRIAEENIFPEVNFKGSYEKIDILTPYVDHLLTYVNIKNLQSKKIVVNAGNGAAGHVLDKINEVFLKNDIHIDFVKMNHLPDGNFPNGIPNPLLKENRDYTSKKVLENKADFGLAWDGDFDRCFFFDEHGKFIEGYYIVGMLAESFLEKNSGGKIIHDPRLQWNTLNIVKKYKGDPICSKTGHAFIKEKMRKEDAVYGGEMSAHHYFKDFGYCDSGMIPWLLVLELLCKNNKSLSQFVSKMIKDFPSSGEINYTVQNASVTISEIENIFREDAIKIDYIDGLSMEFENWRFNLRSSNTEPLLRLNVESRGNEDLVIEKVKFIESIISAGNK